MSPKKQVRSKWDGLLWLLLTFTIASCFLGKLMALQDQIPWFWQAVYGLGALSMLFGFSRYLFFRSPNATNPAHTKTFTDLKKLSQTDPAD